MGSYLPCLRWWSQHATLDEDCRSHQGPNLGQQNSANSFNEMNTLMGINIYIPKNWRISLGMTMKFKTNACAWAWTWTWNWTHVSHLFHVLRTPSPTNIKTLAGALTSARCMEFPRSVSTPLSVRPPKRESTWPNKAASCAPVRTDPVAITQNELDVQRVGTVPSMRLKKASSQMSNPKILMSLHS